MSEAPRVREIPVEDQLDCKLAQSEARQMALAIGFGKAESEEAVLVTAELATNLIRHAGKGRLAFRLVEQGGQHGLEIESLDQGPGILDIERSLADGYSTAGGLGHGLGAVNRLMDELEINSTPGLGSRICCRRWVRPDAGEATYNWDIGIATRPRHYAPFNGDAYIVKEWGDSLLVGLIDGLGHGELAQEAALAAQRYVLSHFDRPLDAVFMGAGRACRGTRGVVMALARFKSPRELEFGTYGNIETRAWCEDKRVLFIAQRGIIGAEQRAVNVQRVDWNPGWVLALHSDGIRERWQWPDLGDPRTESAQAIARKMMSDFGKADDDATVVVVRS